MKITRRTLIAAGAAALGLPGCAPGTPGASAPPAVRFGDPVSLTFWHTQTGANQKALTDAVAKFNALNGKNITLRSEFQGSYQQVFQKSMVAIQAGSPPEAALAFESMVQEYARARAIVDLDDYLQHGASPLTKEAQADLFPAYLDGGRLDAYKRQLLAFPFAKSLAVRYLNEDLVKSTAQASALAPTFEEFRRQAILVTKKDSRGRSLVYGHHIRLDASYVDAFIYANGGELLARDGSKVRFDEAPAVEVFEMWGQMAKDGLAYTTPGFGYQTDFGQAKVASVHDTSASRPFIADAVVERTTSRERFRWGIGMIPQRNPAKPLTATFGGGLVVFKTTPLKQAAMWEWVRYFAERDQTVAWSIASGYMPLRRSAAEHPDLKALWQQSPQAEQSFRLAQYARPEPNITAWQDIRELLTAALSAVVSQSTPAKAALDDAARRANQLIAEKH